MARGLSRAGMFEFRKTGQRQRQTVLLRAWVAGLFALACLLLLAGRLWYLQVVRYDNLSARAEQNRITIVPVPPRRGQIVDRNGAVLAQNLRDYTLTVRSEERRVGKEGRRQGARAHEKKKEWLRT